MIIYSCLSTIGWKTAPVGSITILGEGGSRYSWSIVSENVVQLRQINSVDVLQIKMFLKKLRPLLKVGGSSA